MNTRAIGTVRGASLAALLAGCATAMAASAPTVPENLRVPATQTPSLQVRAVGTQIYDCKPSNNDPGHFEWVFRAPEADLFDTVGNRIGKHYAGPTWELDDGSKVVGEIKARDDGPDASAIPWLLLSAKSNSGVGILGRTASVQRIRTVGGKGPAGVCSQAQAGTTVRVPYSAAYYFYAGTPNAPGPLVRNPKRWHRR